MDEVTARFAQLWWDARSETVMKNTFMGVPCLQHPFDAWTTQEIIFETRPEVLVESGSFAGGSALMWATFMELYDPSSLVVAIDTEHPTRRAREAAIWQRRVSFIHGSSTSPDVVDRVKDATAERRTMVILDAAHDREHVAEELAAYADVVSPGCYLIVQDGALNGHPIEPGWGPGPYEAIQEFRERDDRYQVDPSRERLILTFNPSGFLKRCR